MPKNEKEKKQRTMKRKSVSASDRHSDNDEYICQATMLQSPYSSFCIQSSCPQFFPSFFVCVKFFRALNVLYFCFMCSMQLIVFHLEEQEKVVLEGTMENSLSTRSRMRRQWSKGIFSQTFGLDCLHGTITNWSSLDPFTVTIILIQFSSHWA